MASTEERLTETEKAIGELNTNSTILLGLASDHEIDIRRVSVQITELRAEMTNRFHLVDDRLNQMYDEINSNALLLHEILDRLPAKE